jgi:ABC-type nitrate/sulfonate/bicarbonate transport system substrate-binding protein
MHAKIGLLWSLMGLVLLSALASPDPVWAQMKVQIGTARDPNLGAQIVIARDKGFFKEQGLDVTTTAFPSGGDLMAAFVGGSVQMGTAGSTPVITLKSRPFPVILVAQISDISGAQQLVVHKEVNKLQELYGKQIGLLKATASEALFNSIVEGYGLDAGRFHIVNLGPTEMLQAFVRNQVDAVALWEPHSTRAREAGNGKTLVSGTHSFIPGEEGPKRVYGDHAVLFTHEDFAKKKSATVRAMLLAVNKANAFIQNNREEATKVLAGAFQLTPPQMSQIIEVNNYTLALDDQLVGDMNKLSQFLASLGKISHPADVRTWIDTAPLRSIAPDLVKLK